MLVVVVVQPSSTSADVGCGGGTDLAVGGGTVALFAALRSRHSPFFSPLVSTFYCFIPLSKTSGN